MYFHEAEVVELGLAEELIQEDPHPVNTEGTEPSRIKLSLALYAAEAE
jgi:hypothetical protein